MKRLHLQRRVGKSELRGLRSSVHGVMGVALLLSLLLGVQVGSVHSQEQPGTRRARPNDSCATGPEATGTGRGLPVSMCRTDVIP